MSVYFEWDCEEVADGESEQYEDEEPIDHYHASAYAEVLDQSLEAPPTGSKYRIVLVRDRLDKYDSLVCRSWAYLEDGKLPEYFTDAYNIQTAKVPEKFHNEIKRRSHK